MFDNEAEMQDSARRIVKILMNISPEEKEQFISQSTIPTHKIKEVQYILSAYAKSMWYVVISYTRVFMGG